MTAVTAWSASHHAAQKYAEIQLTEMQDKLKIFFPLLSFCHLYFAILIAKCEEVSYGTQIHLLRDECSLFVLKVTPDLRQN